MYNGEDKMNRKISVLRKALFVFLFVLLMAMVLPATALAKD
jgi:hypothetical protein